MEQWEDRDSTGLHAGSTRVCSSEYYSTLILCEVLRVPIRCHTRPTGKYWTWTYALTFLPGERWVQDRHRVQQPTELRSTESPTPRHAAARDDHFSSLHPNAIVNAGNWRNSSSSSSVTTVSPSATSFVSSTSPQPPGSAADASHSQVLRSLGRWLSTHEYLNTGQDPIIGHDCPPEADVLGIRGMTVLTAFFDHTDRETFRCHVCPDVSYDLEDAILHQRRAMHHQD